MPTIRKRYLIFLIALLVIASFATIVFYDYAVDISNTIMNNHYNTSATKDIGKTKLYVGVISRYPPNIIFKGYQPIIDYLNRNDKYHFELKLSTSYSETLNQLTKGEVTIAFFGTLLYINAHENYGIVPILKPLNEDFKPFFRSVFFTKKNSGINSITDLKGRKIALPSKESFSGNWLIKYELQKYNILETELAAIEHFAYHQNVIYQVLKGNYDAGVVKDRVIKEYKDRDIKIIAYSEPVPGSPIVAAKQYDEEVILTIKELLLKINLENDYFRAIVKNWDKEFIFGFVEAKDSDYDLIRKLLGMRK
jgi:phosphonate transport system substrate-binding protein